MEQEYGKYLDSCLMKVYQSVKDFSLNGKIVILCHINV